VKIRWLEALNYVERHPTEVRFTREFDRWYKALPQEQADAVTARINLLKRVGSSLGRPSVDRIHGADCHNMKELRFRTMRVLFAFASDQRAVMLVGGDKQGRWKRWYGDNIPLADERLARYERSHGKGEPSRSPSSRSHGRGSSSRGR
jgi:hypothetical protein